MCQGMCVGLYICCSWQFYINFIYFLNKFYTLNSDDYLVYKFSLTYTDILFHLNNLFKNHKFFLHIEIQDVNRQIPYEASTIHGTQKLHLVKMKSMKIYLHVIEGTKSCFCSVCIEDTQSTEIFEKKIANYVKT